MALKKVKGNLERIFDKNLTDLVRGIRNNKDNESKYIAQCIEEIKVELRQDNMQVKANAVTKLAYLQMLGYDISWAGFNVIEVMSSSKFTHKRIGYLAASQSFHADLEMLMLTTNMIRKDLSSQNQYEAGVALSALSCFVSPDLARDLSNDIMILLSSTKPYLRKKGVLMLYKIFLKYPDALRPAFPRLKEKLEDPDPGVQSAAVNVICELARKNPKNYLGLAPVFFKLMTTSTNNWMLIKIIKLFGHMTMVDPNIGRQLADPVIKLIQRYLHLFLKLTKYMVKKKCVVLPAGTPIQLLDRSRNNAQMEFGALTPLEPRLGKKLIEPLTNLIHSTSAMSLLYECINTVIAGLATHNSSIELCVQKLRVLIEDSDQNLKYLGLLAMSKILATHPKSVQAHKDLIMRCLDDKDESIRLRALDLLYGMVGKKNLMEIVKKLMVHMEKAEGTTYRDELLTKIIQICCQNNYQHITNFEWYISVLVELSRVEGLGHGQLVASQMMDVAVRVHAIRPFAVEQMSLLLENPYIFFGMALGSTTRPPSMVQVLYAAAWICGEYCTFLSDPKKTLMAMLDPKMVQLPHNIQSVYLQNCLKIMAHLLPSQCLNRSASIPASSAPAHESTIETPIPNENEDGTALANGNATISTEEATHGEVEAKEGAQEDEEGDDAKATVPDFMPSPKLDAIGKTDKASEEALNLSDIQQYLQPFISSEELEVQERAGCLNNFIKCYLKLEQKGLVDDISELSTELAAAFSSELNPVAVKAQKKVPVPDGLNLETWINDPPSDSEEETTETTDVFVKTTTATDYGHSSAEKRKVYEPTEEEITKARETRKQEQELNPHYLKPSSKPSSSSKKVSNGTPEEDLPPIEKLELNVALKVPSFASSEKYLLESKQKKREKLSKKKKKKKSKNKGSEEEEPEPEPEEPPIHVVNTIIEMPEGATISDTEESALPPDDPHRALDIDLDIPLEVPEPVKAVKKSRKSDPNYLQKKKRSKESAEDNLERQQDQPSSPLEEEAALASVPISFDEKENESEKVRVGKKSKSKSKSSTSETKHKSHKKHKKKDKEKKEKKSKKSEKDANDTNLLIEM